MRILTWNVNGIRALVQYHPYCDDLHKNYKEILDYLNADVLCFQETKITRSKLGTDIALVPTYDSYWSFHKRKSGYSGVAVYIKDHHRLVAVEQGISGILSGQMAVPPPPLTPSISRESSTTTPPGTPFELRRISSSASASIPSSATTTTAKGAASTMDNPSIRRIGGYVTHYEPSILQELDSEGRALVLDFGMFVLFNLYCPNETDETRLPFKIAFYTVLEERVHALIAEGREVIIVGDMNVVPSELDHCDPEKWKKDTGISDFTDTEPRRWFNRFLSTGGGPMVDLYRVFHPDEKGAFTCWNTLINARPSNYGTRLDFILVTKNLLPWFKSCDRLPNIVGSDHCPVVCEFWDEIEVPVEDEQDGQLHTDGAQGEEIQNPVKRVRLKDVLESYEGVKDHPLAARMYDEFAGKQQSLFKFFKTPKAVSSPQDSTPLLSATAVTSTSEQSQERGQKRELEATPVDGEKRRKLTSDGSTQLQATSTLSSTLSQGSTESPPSLSPRPSREIVGSSTTPPSAPAAAITATLTSEAKPVRASSTAASSGGWPPKKASTKASATSGSSANKNKSGGQTMLSSFFKRPSDQAVTNQPPVDLSRTDVNSSDSKEDAAPSLSQNTPSSSPSPSSSSSSSSSQIESEFYKDLLETSASVTTYTMNPEETTSKWANLFTKKDVPNCNIHNTPCTEYRVNKKGPNKGRLFYLCSKYV
ncbi:Class II abasic (AP) endonuclease [Actinomortierella wolfii]|nr:Class II abasic (AP) endonuclease [Actinomortierella wolfii]